MSLQPGKIKGKNGAKKMIVSSAKKKRNEKNENKEMKKKEMKKERNENKETKMSLQPGKLKEKMC